MDVTIEAALDKLTEINGRMRKLLEEADPASLDWKPAPDTSSLAVLTTHGLSAEEFLVGLAFGIAVPRDRDAEFAAAGMSKEALLARVDEVNERVKGMIQNGDPAALSVMRTARNRQQSGALCLINAASHMSEHLAHAEITSQLWKQARK